MFLIDFTLTYPNKEVKKVSVSMPTLEGARHFVKAAIANYSLLGLKVNYTIQKEMPRLVA